MRSVRKMRVGRREFTRSMLAAGRSRRLSRLPRQGAGTGGGKEVDRHDAHYQNFIDCVKSRKREELIADIEEGHFSSLLCHLGNISYRTGRRLRFDPEREDFRFDAEATEFLGREYRAGYELPRI